MEECSFEPHYYLYLGVPAYDHPVLRCDSPLAECRQLDIIYTLTFI